MRSSSQLGSSNTSNESPPEARVSVIQKIFAVMFRTPRAIAVSDGEIEWTYESLRRHSDIVRSSLASSGVAPGSVVGMHLPRCAEAIATMLGIMAAGCVYLPLDPSYPRTRIQFMLERAGATAVISQASDPDLYGSDRVWLPTPADAISSNSHCDALSTFQAEPKPFGLKDRAYILFTSGSTGEPKGVMVNHENITLMTEWSAKVLGITASDSSATATSLNFDACFHEILVPLSVGGTVHVIRHALALGQLTQAVSFVACTPTVASELLRAGLLPPLKVLMVGGEVLAQDVADRLLSSGIVGRLLNCYGPTECTVCVTIEEVTAPVPSSIPIGRQVPGTEVRVLDDEGHCLGDGDIGELCIFGGQVADGYVNDPAETAERFIVCVDPAIGPERYYRTGDLGFRHDDGSIHFVGRADRQVKINGCRVELGEVDAILRSHPQVAEATTTVQDAERMVAYVVPSGAGIDLPDLRRFVSEKLPPFMVPAGHVILSELPKTVSGKLDESALPPWSPSRSEQDPLASDHFTAEVARIVADVTCFIGQILPTDDFIKDLGGTSLGIVRVLSELECLSGRRLRITDALADTTMAGLANLLREGSVSSPADFVFNPNGDAPPIFVLHAYLGGMLRLRRLAEVLPSNQPVYGIQVHCTSKQISPTHTVSSLASDALSRIRAIQPSGQITMLGHSAGGLIALEVARDLRNSTGPIPRVLLIDTVRPSNTFGYYWGELLLNLPEFRAGPLGEQFDRLRAAWRRRDIRQDSSKNDDLIGLAEKEEVFTNILIRRYRARSYDGPVTVMRTRQGRLMAFGRGDLGWRSVIRGALDIIDVPGTHINLLEAPYIMSVADKIVEWLCDVSS